MELGFSFFSPLFKVCLQERLWSWGSPFSASFILVQGFSFSSLFCSGVVVLFFQSLLFRSCGSLFSAPLYSGVALLHYVLSFPRIFVFIKLPENASHFTFLLRIFSAFFLKNLA